MPTDATTQLGNTLGTLLTLAWLLPLAGFAVEIFGGFWGTRKSKTAAYLAVACIAGAFLLSLTALLHWKSTTGWTVPEVTHDSAEGAAHEGEHPVATAEHPDDHPSEHAEVAATHPKPSAA